VITAADLGGCTFRSGFYSSLFFSTVTLEPAAGASGGYLLNSRFTPRRFSRGIFQGFDLLGLSWPRQGDLRNEEDRVKLSENKAQVFCE
jgi:hypothetical protein